jgi:ethanolamine ammonia-lyase large subunit
MVQFQKQVNNILSKVSAVALEMGPETFSTLKTNLHDAITNKSKSLTEKRIKARIEILEEHIFDDKAPNAIERQTGCDIPPRLLGFVTVSDLRAGTHMAAIEQELVSRNISDPEARNYTAKVKILMADELRKWKLDNPTEKEKDFPKGIFKPLTDYSNFDTIQDDNDS